MRKILFAIILCLFSSIAFIYSLIQCYFFLYTIVFALVGFIILGGLFVLRTNICNEKKYWVNLLLTINVFFAIAAIGSVCYIYNKYDGKITDCITDKQIAKELGLLVAEYRQTNHVNIENVDIQSDLYIAYESTYEVFNDRSKIRVYPKIFNFILSVSGERIVDLVGWRNEKFHFRESAAQLTSIRNNDDSKPVYITGTRVFVDSIAPLPDTITFHIYNHHTKQDVDSFVFIKDKVHNVGIKIGSEDFSITRKRLLIDKIKDFYIID